MVQSAFRKGVNGTVWRKTTKYFVSAGGYYKACTEIIKRLSLDAMQFSKSRKKKMTQLDHSVDRIPFNFKPRTVRYQGDVMLYI